MRHGIDAATCRNALSLGQLCALPDHPFRSALIVKRRELLTIPTEEWVQFPVEKDIKVFRWEDGELESVVQMGRELQEGGILEYMHVFKKAGQILAVELQGRREREEELAQIVCRETRGGYRTLFKTNLK